MKQHPALSYVCALALLAGVYAGVAQIPTAASPRLDAPAAVAVSRWPMPLGWMPEWLVTPLSRAVADATRSKGK